MSNEIYVLNVYNTTTGEYEKVRVTKAVFNEYLNGEMQKNSRRFYRNEIQFSSLIGYHDDENGEEEWLAKLVDTENDPAEIVPEQMIIAQLYNFMTLLTPDEYELIYSLYFRKMSENSLALCKGVTQQAVCKKKNRILKKLENFFENQGC